MQRDKTLQWLLVGTVSVVIFLFIWLALGYIGSHAIVTFGRRAAIHVYVADTDVSRIQGLSGTNTLASNTGMLFVFDNAEKWPIWMKDMHYALDIVWLGDDKRIVDIADAVSQSSYPEVFTPKKAARYVLELPAHYTDSHAMRVGELAMFTAWPL